LFAHLDALLADSATRPHTERVVGHLRDLATCSYRVVFPSDTDLSERVLWPHAAVERRGMEDARFVRFVEDDGDVTFYATYTAFDGTAITQQLLATKDFVTFDISPVGGTAARGKGLALFPRRVGGRVVALSRFDREANSVVMSDDVRCWDSPTAVHLPTQPWEILQVGNCGSPIETPSGWLVLTHGVGPMRTYSLGALLLDLEDPTKVVAGTVRPLLSPGREHRGGYVPNVVYSCGALAHGDLLVLPYGIGDRTVSICTLSIAELLSTMRPAG
jgi:predicted GH43/DUF377 family glycosyl hydrolase